jgi:GTP-binding protein
VIERAAVHVLHHARFLLGAAIERQFPPDVGFEVAFAGRSNAGKSSVINAVTGQRALARISKTPGRTQQINFFDLGSQRRLVDLPGYGFARVPPAVRERWDRLIDRYLRDRRSLAGMVLVMDARHPLTDFDRRMLQWCMAADLAVHLLLTKADKLRRQKASETLRVVSAHAREATPRDRDRISAQLFSAHTRAGLPELVEVLQRWLWAKKNAPAQDREG